MQIRAARPDDASVLASFNAAMALETEDKQLDPDVLRAGVEALLGDPARGRYLVAERDGEVVGALAVTLEWSDWRNGWFWWIQSVFVSRAARRGGVYRALYEESEVKRSMVGALTERLFRGDAAELVNHLLAEREIEPAELERLKQRIEERQRQDAEDAR